MRSNFRVEVGAGLGRVWAGRSFGFHCSAEWNDDAGFADVLARLPESPTSEDAFRAVAAFLLAVSQPAAMSAVIVSTDGLLAVVAGAGVVRLPSAAGVETLTGTSVAMWSNRVVPIHTEWVSCGEGVSDEPADERLDLRDGVVPGGGFRLSRSVTHEAKADQLVVQSEPNGGTPTPSSASLSDDDAVVSPSRSDPEELVATSTPPPPPPPLPIEAVVAAVPVFGTEPDAFGVDESDWNPNSTVTLDAARLMAPPPIGDVPVESEAPEPEPLGSPGETLSGQEVSGVGTVPAPMVGAASPDLRPPAGDEGGETILGVCCSSGHLNSTSWAECRQCGELLGGREWEQGVRPALGQFVLDDGRVLSADRSYVLGRRPGTDSWDGREVVEPVTIEDSRGAVSKRHFELIVKDWEVRILDRQSRNGTVVKKPGGAEVRLKPGVPIALDLGDEVLYADHWVRFEPPAQISGY